MKLFVSDIDGTLVWYNGKNNKEVSSSCKGAIQKWINKGNRFAVATARTHLKRDLIYNALGLKVDYLGGNGSEIVYANQEIKLHTLPYSYFLEVGKWIEEKGYDATLKICVGDTFYLYKKGNYPFDCKDRMRMYLLDMVDQHLLNANENTVGVNMSLLCKPAFTKEIEKELSTLFKEKCQVLAIDIDDIDFIPNGINKGNAVLELAEKYNIKKEDIIVAGDEANDVCMFKVAGKSYCMSHASMEIQKQADETIDILEEALYKEMNQ